MAGDIQATGLESCVAGCLVPVPLGQWGERRPHCLLCLSTSIDVRRPACQEIPKVPRGGSQGSRKERTESTESQKTFFRKTGPCGEEESLLWVLGVLRTRVRQVWA